MNTIVGISKALAFAMICAVERARTVGEGAHTVLLHAQKVGLKTMYVHM